MLKKLYLKIFPKQKTPKDLNRQLTRTIARTNQLSIKLTSQIALNLRNLQKLLKLQNTNEIKRMSRQIVKMQIRRDKNDQRVNRLEGMKDTLLDAITCNNTNINEIVKVLEKEMTKMESVKGGVKNYEECKMRIETLAEEVCEDEVNDEFIDELAEELVCKTMAEISE
ncbi:hypothetical protein GVAV_000499 [Gurleya vavrai]